MKQVFITGTDTGVGKTVLATILSLKWQAHYWKPIQSGTIDTTDKDYVTKYILPEKTLPEAYSLKEPLSPNQSAEIDKQEIRLAQIEKPKADSPLVVEGAGGIYVPINQEETMLDLMKHLSLPVIVAARSGLGTLNHTLMSLAILKAHQIPVLGVVMIGDKKPMNKRDIEHFSDTPVLLEIPYCDHITTDWMLEMASLFPENLFTNFSPQARPKETFL